MKRICLLLFCLVNLWSTKAQVHELGLFLGGSNTIGDVGSTLPILANSPAYGLVYKWNITTRYAIRASFISSTLKSYDYYAQDLSRFNRFFRIDNNILEFSAGMEVNFFEFDLHDDDREFSPYIFAGVNYFQHQLFTITENLADPVVEKYDTELQFSIPIIVGIKASISPLFIVSLETGVRYSFTDNIDGSNPIGQYENNPTLKLGSIYNKDWYVFTGFTFSYTFGQIPCYCKEK